MKLLIDTHIFLWLISADPRLKAAHKQAIVDPLNSVFLSVASIWEALIKHQIGKLSFPLPADEFLRKQRESHQIASLPVEEGAMPHLLSLPSVHGDPFDRIIVAQAIQHGLTLVTDDPVLKSYPVSCL